MSLLCGKLFDETGDRLTPSHSKTRRGTRLRYYISNRLIARSGEANLDGWRLPASELEARVTDLVRSIWRIAARLARLSGDANADEIGRISPGWMNLRNRKKQVAHWAGRTRDIAPGEDPHLPRCRAHQ